MVILLFTLISFLSTIVWDNQLLPVPKPTSSLFTVSTAVDTNESGSKFIAYCFAEKQGYSKFGNYTGTYTTTAANSDYETSSPYDGPFIYTGFKPAWLMIKRIDDTNNWYIFDNTRDSYQNPFADIMEANSNIVENADTARGDFLSNGVKIRSTANAFNASSGTYIYMAFAESPFVSSAGVPTTAK